MVVRFQSEPYHQTPWGSRMQFLQSTSRPYGELLYIEKFHGLTAYVVWRERRLEWMIHFMRRTWTSKGFAGDVED